jgi:RNA polymerase sigma-70 factor (ECF subfamily)
MPGEELKDSELIHATLAGKTESYGELVIRHQDRLFRMVFQLTGDRQEAEDLVQETFVQAYVKLESFHGASAFFTWLYRIAFNLTVSRSRKKRPTVSVDVAREKGNEPEAETPDVGAEMERAEDIQQLKAALDKLSEEHRAILMLREIEGHDYDTIADLLDVRVGTVRSRLHRARGSLRDILIKEETEKGTGD